MPDSAKQAYILAPDDKTETTDITFILFRRVDGTLELLLQLRDGKARRYPYWWCFPGGGMEDQDDGDPRKAAQREVKEELGLRLTTFSYLLTYAHDHVPGAKKCDVDRVCLAECDPNKEVTCNEGLRFEWMSLDKLMQLPGLAFEQEIILPHVQDFFSK